MAEACGTIVAGGDAVADIDDQERLLVGTRQELLLQTSKSVPVMGPASRPRRESR